MNKSVSLVWSSLRAPNKAPAMPHIFKFINNVYSLMVPHVHHPLLRPCQFALSLSKCGIHKYSSRIAVGSTFKPCGERGSGKVHCANLIILQFVSEWKAVMTSITIAMYNQRNSQCPILLFIYFSLLNTINGFAGFKIFNSKLPTRAIRKQTTCMSVLSVTVPPWLRFNKKRGMKRYK